MKGHEIHEGFNQIKIESKLINAHTNWIENSKLLHNNWVPYIWRN